jgi:hypothetical protein
MRPATVVKRPSLAREAKDKTNVKATPVSKNGQNQRRPLSSVGDK